MAESSQQGGEAVLTESRRQWAAPEGGGCEQRVPLHTDLKLICFVGNRQALGTWLWEQEGEAR